jgi:hypothetical protein
MGFAGLIGQFFYCNFKTESPPLTRASALPNNLPGQQECLTTVSALCKNQRRLSARSATASEAGVYIQPHPLKPAG